MVFLIIRNIESHIPGKVFLSNRLRIKIELHTFIVHVSYISNNIS